MGRTFPDVTNNPETLIWHVSLELRQPVTFQNLLEVSKIPRLAGQAMRIFAERSGLMAERGDPTLMQNGCWITKPWW